MSDEAQTEFLSVSYGPDDEHMGRLYVRVRFDGFEGRGEAWIDRLQCSEFAERLNQYPLDHAATFSSGLGAGSEYVEFIGMSASARGGKGQVIVRVHVASEVWRDGTPTTAHEVTIEFPTSYEYLRRFSSHLHGVLDGVYGEATLSPDLLV